MGDAHYLTTWDKLLIPVSLKWKPDLIVVSAGFDRISGDPLRGMEVTPEGVAFLVRMLQQVQKKCVVALEGGESKGTKHINLSLSY